MGTCVSGGAAIVPRVQGTEISRGGTSQTWVSGELPPQPCSRRSTPPGGSHLEPGCWDKLPLHPGSCDHHTSRGTPLKPGICGEPPLHPEFRGPSPLQRCHPSNLVLGQAPTAHRIQGTFPPSGVTPTESGCPGNLPPHQESRRCPLREGTLQSLLWGSCQLTQGPLHVGHPRTLVSGGATTALRVQKIPTLQG